MKSQIRRMFSLVVIVLLVVACGGGDGTDGGADGSAETTAPDQPGTTAADTASTAPPTDDSTGGTTSGATGSGDGSMTYTLTGGVEASGEADLFPGMSFYDGGVWSIAFSDESASLILINLDPSTPSINITTGTENVGGTSVECDFQIDRQDENGAAGSIECSDAATTGAGGLLDGTDISATFDANP